MTDINKHTFSNLAKQYGLAVQLMNNQQMNKIGIGITYHNRHEVFLKSYTQIIKYAPPGAKIVVVDDASDVIFPHYGNDYVNMYRFDKNVGIAAAKNKCFELLDDCDHVFLFDDDMYPVVYDWWMPYVYSAEPHLMYIFEDFAHVRKVNDTTMFYSDGEIKAYSHARGVMCYFERRCLDIVGGMDIVFGKWGYEHPDLSNRIYNAGLTTFRYMDVVDSEKMFHCMDEHIEVKSTCWGPERSMQINRNKPIYETRYHTNKEYFPYKEGAVKPYEVVSPPVRHERDIVLTCYLTSVPDPQRDTWVTRPSEIEPLLSSTEQNGAYLTIINDCIDTDVFSLNGQMRTHHLYRVTAHINPYFQRWVSYRSYLIQHRHKLGNVFCVDATDVEMLHDPFPHMEAGKLYTGDEPGNVGTNVWLLRHHRNHILQAFFRGAVNTPILNAGLLGGDVDTVIEFCGHMIEFYSKAQEDAKFKRSEGPGMTDMGAFNYVARKYFSDRLSYGRHVNTVFKANERNSISWFKHK